MKNSINFAEYFDNPFVITPYYTFSSFLKKYFGRNIYKTSIDGGFTCPNRDGTLSDEGCIYCSNTAFSSAEKRKNHSIKEQINLEINYLKKRYKKAGDFIAYFQAYTNTYKPANELRKLYDEALSHKDIVGLAIGTRPDCIDNEKLDLLAELAEKTHLWLEFGLQSMHPNSLTFINRGHSNEIYLNAMEKCTKIKNLNLCTHLILGLPDENMDMMKESINYTINAGTNALKLHHLQVIKNTNLEYLYTQKPFNVLNFNEYLYILGEMLSIIPRNIIMQRMFAESQPGMLLAPEWGLRKGNIWIEIDKYLNENNIYQGKYVN